MAYPIRRNILTAEAGDLNAITTGGADVTFASVPLSGVEPGSLCALVAVTIATGSVAIAPRWQVSDDDSAFYDLREGAGPAPVTITATGNRVLAAPKAASAWKFARPVLFASGADATTGDTYSVTTRYIRRSVFNGS